MDTDDVMVRRMSEIPFTERVSFVPVYLLHSFASHTKISKALLKSLCCSDRRATSALTNRRRHGRSYPGARVRWAPLRGSGILPKPNRLLRAVRGESFEKASRSAGRIYRCALS